MAETSSKQADGNPNSGDDAHVAPEANGNVRQPDAVVDQIATDRLAEPVSGEGRPRLAFTVVGVGASAGGLEAFTEFLQHCEPDGGMAYVLIQHLSPKHQSMLAEILSKHTTMPVLQVEEGVKVQPNHVYVIRPGFTMTIHDGYLHLGESAALPMHRRPVDDFFKSLAEEQRERSVAVILSGTGSNGTLGCESIKTVGGFVIAEDPQSAKFPQMPRSLINSNLADAILRPKEMFAAIRRYAAHPYSTGEESGPLEVAYRERRALNEMTAILRARTRHDFSVYKKPTVVRRIQRRMSLLQVEKMVEYVRVLRQSPGEASALADDLMIHVTGFFRDPEVWESLRANVIQPLVSEKPDHSSIRCWVTACSSGEEAYTLGILLLEACEMAGKHFDIKIFATDTAERSLSQARSGLYPGGIESEIAPDRLARFFDRDDAFYRVNKELRELVLFAPQNVLQDPPFSRLDICTCRNLLIYIEGDTQRSILRMLHFGLRVGGALLLGTSESITGAEDLFEPVDKDNRIFRRVGPARHSNLEFPTPHVPRALFSRRVLDDQYTNSYQAGTRATVPQLASRTLLEQYTPAAVVVDRSGQIAYLHGNTSQFLSLPTGEPTRELLALANEGVRGSLRIVMQKAMAENALIRHRDGTVGEGAERQRVEVTAAPLGGLTGGNLFIVSFQLHPDPPASPEGDGKNSGVNEEMARIRDELQSTIEALQSSNEEMKASHEEVTSINEELQSTNEELETSKEELQSLNEELTTVNAQLQAKMDEVERTGNDLSSLLSSTEIAMIFLDTRFRIRRFTPSAKDLVELLGTDAGRPLKDFAWKFEDPTLLSDSQRVLDKLVPIESEFVAHNGRTYIRRALPYRTADNRIDGVVLTFIDTTDRRLAEASSRSGEAWLAAQKEAFQAAVTGAPLETSLGILMRTAVEQAGGDMRCALYEADPTGTMLNHVVGMPLSYAEYADGFKIGPDSPSCGLAAYNKRPVITADVNTDPLWEPWRWLASKYDFRAVWSFPIETSDGKVVGTFAMYYKEPRKPSPRDLEAAAVITRAASMIMSRHEAVYYRRVAQRDLYEGELRFQALLELDDLAIVTQNVAGTITGWNRGAEQIIGFAREEAVGRHVELFFTPEDRESGAAEHEMAVAAQKGAAPDERWHLRKDGVRFWASGVLAATRDPKGTLLGYIKVLRDETVRKQITETVQSAKEAAELGNRMKDEFLATLSHELRTPLSAILIYAKILRGQADLLPQFAEGLDAISRSAEAQKQLIDDLLDTSRITSGSLRLQLRPVALRPLIQESIETVSVTAEAKGVALRVNLADVGTVRADPDRLRQVVWNLLTNAVKFTPAGGSVDLALTRRDREVTIRVSDTGQGIDARFLAHVFEPFRQADASSSRYHGGLGLGLAIVKRLVEQHGGTVTADSSGIDQGSTFVVRLPLPALRDRVTKPSNESPLHMTRVAEDEIDLTGMDILLVEDEAETRNAVTSLLQKTGANVHAVASADAALLAFEQARPDLLVSDVGMSGEDGYSLIRKIREIEARDNRRPVPAAALTAFARDEDREKAFAAGFNRHIAKPVDPTQLLRTLQDLAVDDDSEAPQ